MFKRIQFLELDIIAVGVEPNRGFIRCSVRDFLKILVRASIRFIGLRKEPQIIKCHSKLN